MATVDEMAKGANECLAKARAAASQSEKLQHHIEINEYLTVAEDHLQKNRVASQAVFPKTGSPN